MDDTIAHYTGLMPAVDSVIPECAFLGRNRIRKTGRDDVILANFLCDLPPDTGIPVLEQRSKNSRQLLESNLSTNLFPKALFVECPDGHMTHVYLACDVHSTCFALDSSTSVSCAAPLTPLPPSFMCNNGVQHVPYTLVCDHRSDCSDRSDERFCVFTPCNVTSQFQCRNQQVICSASSTSLFLPPPPSLFAFFSLLSTAFILCAFPPTGFVVRFFIFIADQWQSYCLKKTSFKYRIKIQRQLRELINKPYG